LTAQNTLGVQDIMAVPPAFVAAQMTSILSDIGADMMKTGMLATREVIEAVAEQRSDLAPQLPMIIDPVMVATSGDKLLQDSAMDALVSLLVNHALIVTPNLPEAGLLTRRDVDTLDDMKRAADTLMRDGAHATLIKGGHGTGKVVTDLLAMQSGFEVFEQARIDTKNTHGTGCTLASALAGQLANAVVAANIEDAPLDSKGRPDDAVLKTACEAALTYVHRAITNAPNIGGGNGPLGHGV
jgi:hydroxymethylpyrimidine/phosphomethylpyrimidine kinase